jgi:hypothetical protein
MDGYNDDNYDRTRDFLSQPDLFAPASGYDIFSNMAYPFLGSSAVSAPQVGIAALDLNSQGEGWPGMAGYQASFAPTCKTEASAIMWPPPFRIYSGIHTLDLRAAHNGGRGGAMVGRAILSPSDGGRCPPLPPVTADVRGSCGSTSGVPTRSRSRDGRRRPATTAIAEDNFDINHQNAAKDDESKEILPNAQGPVHSQTQKNMLGVGFYHFHNVCTYSCYAWIRLEWTGEIGQNQIPKYYVIYGLTKLIRVTTSKEP